MIRSDSKFSHNLPTHRFFFNRSSDLRDLHSFPTRRSSDLSPARSFGGRSFLEMITWGLEATSARGSKDRKSTRLNSSHGSISYAVFCLKKKITAIVHFGGYYFSNLFTRSFGSHGRRGTSTE